MHEFSKDIYEYTCSRFPELNTIFIAGRLRKSIDFPIGKNS